MLSQDSKDPNYKGSLPKGEALTHDRLKALLHYDPETGILSRRQKSGLKVTGTNDGNGYLLVAVDGRLYKAHRLAWFYMIGEWPELSIDHKNGVRNDNRFFNLRQATNVQNLHNRSLSEVKGFYWKKSISKWCACIKVNNKTKFLGSFSAPEDARRAYLVAKATLHNACFREAQ